jgi:hypothetical protein
MANSARVHTDGYRLYLLLDPNTGTLTQPAETTQSSIDAVSITASGGDVEAVKMYCPKKYPFVDLSTNQFKLCLILSRKIEFGETVSIDLPEQLVSDGTRYNPSVSSLSVTNRSYVNGGVEDVITDTTPIVYIDPTSGNDTNAAAVNSGDGYYVRTDTEVGSDPTNPAGSIVAYATVSAAAANCATGGSGLMLFKRGETIDGTTNYAQSQRIMPNRKGTADAPFIFAAYGSGDLPYFAPSATGSEGSRVFNFKEGGDDSHLIIQDLDMSGFGAGCIDFNVIVGGEYMENFYFRNCIINGAAILPDQNGNQGRLVERVVFDECELTNDHASRSWVGSSKDFDSFTVREWSIINCVVHDIGDSALEHAFYSKMFGDFFIYRNIIDNCTGNGMKTDSSWGVHMLENIFTRSKECAEISSNGDDAAGVQVDRTEDTETAEYPVIANADGAYAKWICIEKNINIDVGNAYNNQVFLANISQAYDCLISDNLLYADQDILTYGLATTNSPGSSNGYTRDGYNNEVTQNTFVLDATTTTGQRGLRIEAATTDSFDATAQDDKGQHNFTFTRNIVFTGSGATGSNTYGMEIQDDSWEDAETAGRLSGTVKYNCFYRQGGVQTGFYQDDTTSLDSISALESALNQVTGTTAEGNRFEDPGFNNKGYKMSTWVVSQGYTDLDDFVTTMASGVIDGSVNLNTIITTAQDAIRAAYAADGLVADDYTDDILPGILQANNNSGGSSGGSMGATGTYYEATLPNPTAALTDYSVVIDLSGMPAGFWSTVDTTDGTKGRATKEDGTELPCDWIAFDNSGETGLLRVKWSGTLASSGTQKIRVFPPVSTRASYAAGDTYGGHNAYDDKWGAYLPLQDNFLDRTANNNEGTATVTLVAGDATGQIGSATEFAAASTETITISDDTSLDAATALTVMAWVKGSANLWNGVMSRMSGGQVYVDLRERGSSTDMSINADTSASAEVESRGGDFTAGSTWHHYAGIAHTADGTELYEDGTSVDSDAGLPELGTGAGDLVIGKDAKVGNAYWNGPLQEIQYHTTERSAEWIAYEYALTSDNATQLGSWSSGTVEAATGDPAAPIRRVIAFDMLMNPRRR